MHRNIQKNGLKNLSRKTFKLEASRYRQDLKKWVIVIGAEDKYPNYKVNIEGVKREFIICGE
jgi:hypothetical protein